jgi:hypothetical protein
MVSFLAMVFVEGGQEFRARSLRPLFLVHYLDLPLDCYIWSSALDLVPWWLIIALLA